MNELSFARTALKEFNVLVAADPRLSELFIRGEYDFLQLYQPLIFLDMRRLYRATQVAQEKNISMPHGSRWFLDRLLVAVTAVAVCLYSACSVLWFWLSRKKVLLFSSDKTSSQYAGDFRIEGIYTFLYTRNIPFFECFHTVLNRTWFYNLTRRRRPALFIEAIDTAFSLFFKRRSVSAARHAPIVTTGTDTLNVDRVNELITTYAARIPKTLFRIRVLGWIFKHSAVRSLLTIDSVRRYGEVVAACHVAGIRTFAFQHGQFTKYQVGWLKATEKSGNIIRPQTLFVWSEYWKQELERLGTYFLSNELQVGGNPKGGVQSSVASLPATSVLTKPDPNRPFHVLMLYESDTPQAEVRAFIRAALAEPDIIVHFKIRPDLSRDIQLARYKLTDQPKRLIIGHRVDFADIDIVIGSQSTFLYEAVEALKPVYILPTSLDYADGMIERGLAERLSPNEIHAANLCTTLRARAADVLPDELVRRRHTLLGARVVQISDTLRGLETFLQ